VALVRAADAAGPAPRIRVADGSGPVAEGCARSRPVVGPGGRVHTVSWN
jgi:hypothetical protein